MARKTIGFVKLQWTCPNCSTTNPGPNKFCTGCGAPQPEDVQFEQPERTELIQDQEEITRAKAGPDIHCAFCSARNRGDSAFCGQCGADLKEGKKRESGQVLSAFRTGPPKDIACRACGVMNPDTAFNCAGCGAPLPKKTAVPAPKQPEKATGRKFGLGCLIASILGFFGLIMLLVLFFSAGSTEGVTGTVQSTNWERVVEVQALQAVTKEAFRDQIPASAVVRSCEEKYRRTQGEPAANSVEICGTPYTVDKGSGYAEVVQDCQYEVYDDYCVFMVDEWRVIDSATLRGTDLFPQWPDPRLDADQRQGDRKERYTAVFSSSQGILTYNFTSPSLYQQLRPGSKWNLEVNQSGRIVSISPE